MKKAIVLLVIGMLISTQVLGAMAAPPLFRSTIVFEEVTLVNRGGFSTPAVGGEVGIAGKRFVAGGAPMGQPLNWVPQDFPSVLLLKTRVDTGNELATASACLQMATLAMSNKDKYVLMVQATYISGQNLYTHSKVMDVFVFNQGAAGNIVCSLILRSALGAHQGVIENSP